MIHPEDQQSYKETFTTSIRDGKPFSIEYCLKHKDGTFHYWVLENAKPMFSADSTISNYIGSCTEIHQQKT